MSEASVPPQIPLSSAIPSAGSGIADAQSVRNALIDQAIAATHSGTGSSQSAADALRSLPLQRAPEN